MRKPCYLLKPKMYKQISACSILNFMQNYQLEVAYLEATCIFGTQTFQTPKVHPTNSFLKAS